MQQIYLDNAATSYPKPAEVGRAMLNFMENIGCNINRGGYTGAYTAAAQVLDTRERICRLFGGSDARNVIFTANVTMSLNMIIKGFLHSGDHVLVSAMEHNAVMRPLTQLCQTGVSFDRIPCNEQGELDLDAVEPLLRPNTRAIIMTHASNVSGTILPIREVGEICRLHHLRLIVDCAQTGGTEMINLPDMQIDALAFTGHKGLLGPQGIGGFLVTDAFAAEITPLIAGGTGSFSDLETMPALLPDRFEAGTLNLPGICGLNAALQYLEKTGIDTIRNQERALAERFADALRGDTRVRIVGSDNPSMRTSVVSLDFLKQDNAEAAFVLDSVYGIMTRCGLHCAPNAHRTLGTFPQGTVRFSFGYQNTIAQVDYAADAVHHILEG